MLIAYNAQSYQSSFKSYNGLRVVKYTQVFYFKLLINRVTLNVYLAHFCIVNIFQNVYLSSAFQNRVCWLCTKQCLKFVFSTNRSARFTAQIFRSQIKISKELLYCKSIYVNIYFANK